MRHPTDKVSFMKSKLIKVLKCVARALRIFILMLGGKLHICKCDHRCNSDKEASADSESDAEA